MTTRRTPVSPILTFDAWRAELQRLGGANEVDAEGVMTGPEWAEKWGVSLNTARRMIRSGMALGFMRLATKSSTRMDGIPTLVRGYAFSGDPNGDHLR